MLRKASLKGGKSLSSSEEALLAAWIAPPAIATA